MGEKNKTKTTTTTDAPVNQTYTANVRKMYVDGRRPFRTNLSLVLRIRVIVHELPWHAEVWHFAEHIVSNKNVTGRQILHQETKSITF